MVQATFVKDEECKFQLKYQHFIATTLAEWSKTAPQRYAAFRAMRCGDQTLEEALATPIQSVGRYLSWTEAAHLATPVQHTDRQLLETAIKKFRTLAEGVAPHKFRTTIKNLFAHKS
jgi:hypothetical protein